METLKTMKATLIDGELYVHEQDCRANISAALASKKPLLKALDTLDTALRDLLDVITNDELIPESVSYMKQARLALLIQWVGKKGES